MWNSISIRPFTSFTKVFHENLINNAWFELFLSYLTVFVCVRVCVHVCVCIQNLDTINFNNFGFSVSPYKLFMNVLFPSIINLESLLDGYLNV